MIALVEFSYEAKEQLTKLSVVDDIYTKLKEIIPNAPDVEHRELSYYWPNKLVIDLETDGRWLNALALEFTIKKFKGTMPLAAVLPNGERTNVYVQVPHVGLLTIDEVEVEENCCTDKLQGRLDKGWRILCVCPPNAARRPDYILGRTRER